MVQYRKFAYTNLLMAAKIPTRILARQHEIVAEFLHEIDKHLTNIVQGTVSDMMEIRDIAALMHIHPTHLSNTIKLVTGQAPCFFFEEKILDIARRMLAETDMPVAAIARQLTYDPSNFTKFFKRFQGCTPARYREDILLARYAAA